jgi:hypothetical protein
MNLQHARQLRLWKREKAQAINVKEQKKQFQERAVQSYVNAATATSSRVQESLQMALQEGLQPQAAAAVEAAANKRARLEPDPPAAFCTLARELIMGLADSKMRAAPSSSTCWEMQANSNFATMGMILNQTTADSRDCGNYYYYYEVRLVTGGVAQIGWATAPSTATTETTAVAATGFRPSSDNGEGAGDDAFSWAYAPSRELYLHNGKEQSLIRSKSKKSGGGGPAVAGDVIGCAYSYPAPAKKGTVQFYCNGRLVGQEKNVDTESTGAMLYPAISCNQGEILELRVDRNTMSYLPPRAQPVGELLASPEVLDELDDDNDDKEEEEEEGKESPQGSKADTDNETNQDCKVPALEPEPTKPDPVVPSAPPIVVTPEPSI